MTYNVLSAASAESGLFTCSAELLRIQQRSQHVVQQVRELRPSVLCLQEVDNVREIYGPALAALQLDHVHSCRTGKADGEGVWYDRRRWACRASETVYFGELERIARAETRPNHQAYSNPNVAQIALLESLAASGGARQQLVVSSLHLWWKPDDSWLRVEQIAYFYAALERFVLRQHASHAPLIVAGDLNTRPQSKVYAFLQGHGLQSAYAAYPHHAQTVRQQRTPRAYNSTRSSDLAANEAPFTSVNGARTETIDYIFYSRTRFAVEALLDVPDLSHELHGLPSACHPSDHIPLVADLRFLPD